MIEAGQVFLVDCPFIRAPFEHWDEEGSCKVLSWRPGVVWDLRYPDDADMRAHGMGKVRYEVVSVAKLPRPYPTRVFFTRKWLSPDNREFGTKKLRVMTLEAFRRRCQSYKPAGADDLDHLIVKDLTEEERREALSR